MFCTECGTKLDDNAAFCPNCGHKMAAAGVSALAQDTEPVSQPLYTEPASEPATQPMNPEPVAQPLYSEPSQQNTYSSNTMNQTMDSTQQTYGSTTYDNMNSTYETSNSVYGSVDNTYGASSNTYGNTNNSYDTNSNIYGSTNNTYDTNSNIYGSTNNTYGANSNAYGSTNNTYGANSNAYGNTNNTYGAPNNGYAANPTYVNNAKPPKKKKGKGCLIAVIIASIVGILAVLLIVLLIIGGILVFGDKGNGSSQTSGNNTSQTIGNNTSQTTGNNTSQTTGNNTSQPQPDVPNTPSGDSYAVTSIDKLYGEWYGTTQLVSVSGADQMQKYLEGLYGTKLTSSEAEDLSATTNGDSIQFTIYEYYDEEEYKYYPGSWETNLYMGPFFGYQEWDDWDVMTYEEFREDRSAGCIKLDNNGYFEVSVKEVDYLGEYGTQFFNVNGYSVSEEELEEDGVYGFTMTGFATEDANGNITISGQIVITFEYGNMTEPYTMTYNYTMTK